jgi:hypothetical protein
MCNAVERRYPGSNKMAGRPCFTQLLGSSATTPSAFAAHVQQVHQYLARLELQCARASSLLASLGTSIKLVDQLLTVGTGVCSTPTQRDEVWRLFARNASPDSKRSGSGNGTTLKPSLSEFSLVSAHVSSKKHQHHRQQQVAALSSAGSRLYASTTHGAAAEFRLATAWNRLRQ